MRSLPHLLLVLALSVAVRTCRAFQPSGAGRLPLASAARRAASSPRSSTVQLLFGNNNNGAGGDGNDNNPLASLGSQLGSAIKEAAKSQLETLQKEAAAAAMQDPLPDMSNPISAPARPLPDSFENSIELAADACNEALADGITQLVIEFDTSAGDETYNMLSRTLKFVQPFLAPFAEVVPLADGIADEPPPEVEAEAEGGDASAATPTPPPPPPPRLQVLFPDEGTAAYVRNNWQAELPAGTACGSMPRAQLLEGVEALMLVAPAATEVPAVQRLLAQVSERAPTTVVLLVNPKLVDMQSTGYGLVGRELRNMVADAFTVSFALKTYPVGASYRVYPDGWSVWREDEAAEGGYALAYSSMRRPSGDEIDDLIYVDGDDDGEGGDGPGMMDGLGKFIKGFQAM